MLLCTVRKTGNSRPHFQEAGISSLSPTPSLLRHLSRSNCNILPRIFDIDIRTPLAVISGAVHLAISISIFGGESE